jgi:hypothetical protein
MEPSYIFILFLACIASKLIYDTSIGKKAAYNKLNEIHAENERMKLSIDYLTFWERNMDNPSMFEQSTSLIARFQYEHDTLNRKYSERNHLETEFWRLIERLPRHEHNKLKTKYHCLSDTWISKGKINDIHDSFFLNIKRFINRSYSTNNLTSLRFAMTYLEMADCMTLNDGTQIDKESVQHQIDKWELNEKLKTTLQPKKKTKVVKI